VVAYFQARRVILFGSAARGDAGPDSDTDLLVVADDDTLNNDRILVVRR
jgi:predicted nucleotidyltransferase